MSRLPTRQGEEPVLNMMVGITRAIYSKYLVGGLHGASRDKRQERN